MLSDSNGILQFAIPPRRTFALHLVRCGVEATNWCKRTSAYEYATDEKLSEHINTYMLDGLMTGNQEKVEYYNELSSNKNTKKQICNIVIRKIKDWLNLAS